MEINPMPTTPYIVKGIINDSKSNPSNSAIIEFKSANATKTTASDSSGKYLFDLADIDYVSGETISYSVKDKYNNEYYSGSFVVSGSNKTLNVTLSVRENAEVVRGNRDTQIYGIGGRPISQNNPFPVTNVNNSEIDLVNNPATSWTITRPDGQPDKETITLASGDVYYRTFTYTSNILTARSKWQKL